MNMASKNKLCSRECQGQFYSKTTIKPCAWCGKSVSRTPGQVKKNKSTNIFCNCSCAASYNNTQKRSSNRRSKSESKLFDLLSEQYEQLEFLANDKSMLDGYEVDIAIPQIKLAIEWNGIIHYKPIYGSEKLNKVQKRDSEKQHVAKQKGINLIVITDLASKDSYVKEVFHKICFIINDLLSK